ncbi:MAG TPA: hypothetical protein VMF06_16650 [Candidatus Limnocylindria bacterium]|jgi:hypothetical protein|nr:hypothetical protein [Candidatus Limnocylindria bacterium]
MDEGKRNDEGARAGEAAAHQLPPAFVQAIFGCAVGALPVGLAITLVAAPGNQGSAVYGLLLPWSISPFILAITMAWKGRFLPHAALLGRRILFVGFLGAAIYGYAFLFARGPVDDRKWFAFVPLWQWLLLARPLTKVLREL